MIVNFKTYKINQDTRKLVRILILIKKKTQIPLFTRPFESMEMDIQLV
jgi:hypothetical protein